ncbi:flagellar biosynthesis protein FlgA [Zhengella mangrovi]|uniref:Flagellar biosynthesis protein FlgA n=1 Tax=Zhengella mangrovi TaxID=1982044 RepID=A0A2G1QSR5_9HYPH|nr:Gfo/Idh/MocA family oxidoreductase [Zhengella mangrovi]PHP68586.1 flagellar biosynthesis protein FlgA [Zhengella mangrovi]
MNLHRLALERAESGKPVRAGLIGAGKFGSMFLSQVPTMAGLKIAAIADLDPDRARAACRAVGWDEDRIGTTLFLDSGTALAQLEALDVVIEATGHPAAGAAHAVAAIDAGKHVVMVNVEADVLCGPALAKRARQRGVVYSMAYGDQPALVAEMVDWARAAGFTVQAAGKGTKYLPSYHHVTPDEVWSHYGLTPEEAKAAGMNSQMFNSFLDGTKSAIEMAAIANACGLSAPDDGLAFPPCGVDDLAHVLRPSRQGGQVGGEGVVEVVSSLERDGRPVFRNLRWGVYVVLKAPNAYSAACFRQYGLPTDSTGLYAAMYKPFHLIGMELGISVLSAALRGEPTGQSLAFRADAVAVAKRDLKPGDMLDGEGGYTVYGKCLPAARSVALGALPIGLAHGLRMTRAVARGTVVTRGDVEAPAPGLTGDLRAETEAMAAV